MKNKTITHEVKLQKSVIVILGVFSIITALKFIDLSTDAK